jgi:hypothetical protein
MFGTPFSYLRPNHERPALVADTNASSKRFR